MSGRERPLDVRSPGSRAKEIKHASPVQCTGFKEEKQKKKRTKTQEPQKSNHAEEKPAVQKTPKEKATKHLTKESNEEQHMPTESTKAKTCSSTAKSQKRPPRNPLKTQLELETAITLEAPKELKASPANTKPKASSKAEFQTEETNDEECADETMQKMPKAKADVDNSVLKSILGNLKIKVKDRSDSSKVVNSFRENLVKYLKKTIYFHEVQKPLCTGSYYENLKILHPDEFDIMLCMPVERVKIEPFGTNGAFYSVALKRDKNPLMTFQKNDILPASEILKQFRESVKTFAKGFTASAWTMTPKRKGCPAVTLTCQVGSVTISLDVVLCLSVKSSWPSFTKNGLKIEEWLGTKVKQEHKRKPYYLVPKYEGRGNVENDGVQAKDAWRVSFSHIEKDIIKKHGSQKTCCEKGGANCCRKGCLKLLKYLLHLLKESNSTFDKFCSYHAKTTFLHACCSKTKDTDWGESDLSQCFNRLLQDFEKHLRCGELFNFFIPSQNLLSGIGRKLCTQLADTIKEQRENGFPIFKERVC
ncbi:cyclic GMP-AMP synthase [Girardinichthys multiradiatus]|uniref:cyclic GMP-AMP synthase n=1 Tax=Girardinichthys multiradiatus TaxID=208333 RepID=UPI001FABF11A|nr:cyclic GMP-AMP synthase [Girardinichthys multiradiatus]